jgi:hypothetical protein
MSSRALLISEDVASEYQEPCAVALGRETTERKSPEVSLLVLGFQLAQFRVRGLSLCGSSLDSGGRLLLLASPLQTGLENSDPVGPTKSRQSILSGLKGDSVLLSTDLESAPDPAGHRGARKKGTLAGHTCRRDLVRDLLVGIGLGQLEELLSDEEGWESQEMLLVALVGERGGTSCTFVCVEGDGAAVGGSGSVLGPHCDRFVLAGGVADERESKV